MLISNVVTSSCWPQVLNCLQPNLFQLFFIIVSNVSSSPFSLSLKTWLEGDYEASFGGLFMKSVGVPWAMFPLLFFFVSFFASAIFLVGLAHKSKQMANPWTAKWEISLDTILVSVRWKFVVHFGARRSSSFAAVMCCLNWWHSTVEPWIIFFSFDAPAAASWRC